MPSFLSICLALLKFAIATTNVIQALLIELHNAVEWLRDGQDSSITISTEDKSPDLSLLEPLNSDAANSEPVASSTESITSSDFTESSSTSNSGTESVLSEPNNMTILDPLIERSMPSSFRSSLESQDNCQNASVEFINEPLLTKNDRIDSMEKIELVIKPTCEFMPQEASIFPQMQSQFSSPSLTDSDTPENIKYIEKASRLLTVYTKLDHGQEYCDVNSSTTEFPVSGSPTSATDNEDAVESTNLPQLHVESPSSTENDKSPSKECDTQSSVRFLLPDSHIERESKGFRRESKFRKKPNETSTSEEENEAKVSRKRRASPGKFHKSPKKIPETTASKIRRYKLSPQMKSDEKNREDTLSYENTSATRSLEFDFGIQQKSENDTDLLVVKDENNLNLKLGELISRTIEDYFDEKASFQQGTLKSESANETISKPDSIPETIPSATAVDNIEVSASEGTEGFSPEVGSQEQMPVPDCTVDRNENGCKSASEGTKVFSSFENETFAFQETAIDSKAHFAFKGDASSNGLVKDSTYFDNKCNMSLTGHLKLVDTNILHESKLPGNDELASDKNNEKRTSVQENEKLECTLNIHLLESEKNSNSDVQLETTDQVSNEESYKESETVLDENFINEKSGKDSCHEGLKCLASQLESKMEESLNSDKNEDKSESSNFSTSDNSTDKNLVKNYTLEADTDNFSVLKEGSHQINAVVNVDSFVEMVGTFSIGQGKTDEVASMKVPSSSMNSQSEDQSPERKRKTDAIISEIVPLLLSPSKSSSNEADEESTISKTDTDNLSVLTEVSHQINTVNADNIVQMDERFSIGKSKTDEVESMEVSSSFLHSQSEDQNLEGTRQADEIIPEIVSLLLSPSKSSSNEADEESTISKVETDNFTIRKEFSHQINAVVNEGSIEVNETFSIGQSKTDEVESMEVSSSSLHSQSEDQNPERTQQTNEIKSEIVSILLSPSKSSSNEADEESTINKEDGETSDYRSSNLNTDVKKYSCSKGFFTPVLEELLQRFESTSQSSSPTKTQALLSSLELQDKVEVSADLQHSIDISFNSKDSNYKNYFGIVLKDLVQQVKLTTVSNSFTSIKDEESRVLKVEVLSKTSIETSPLKDSTKTSILNETETEVNVDVHSENLITDAENVKQDNLEFELHVVPQPVPCETAIQIKVENLISNEISSDLSEIKIVDSKTSENELNAKSQTPAEPYIFHLNADQEKGDSYSRCPVASVPNEATTAEILPCNDYFNTSMSTTTKALVELTNDDFTSNTLVEESKDNFIESAVNEVTNNDISDNTRIEVTYKCTEKALIEMAREVFTDNSNVEETKENFTENILVETTLEETAGGKLVEISEDDPEENNITDIANCSNESSLVELAKCDSTENAILDVVKDHLNENNSDVMHDCSVESNAAGAFTNLDSSVAEEASANDREESSNENKPWKKKQRKSKKKRRN